MSCRLRMHAGKISPQLTGIAAGIIKYIRCLVFLNALVDLAHSGIAWNSRMELFHCIEDDGIEDGNETPSSRVGCRGK